MPIYEYKCNNGHLFEVMQRISDDPVEACEVCEEPVERVLHPVAIHFKGSGFHSTDYGRSRQDASSRDGKESGDGREGKGDSEAGSKAGGTKESSDKSGSSTSKGSADKAAV